jgi:hypothetical protein
MFRIFKRAKLCESAVAMGPFKQQAESGSEWIQLRHQSWAALIRLVYESDPLLCPKCRTQMKIATSVPNLGSVICSPRPDNGRAGERKSIFYPLAENGDINI